MIVDAHLDIAWNAVAEGRGFEQPARGYLVSRPALVEAGVGLVFATIYCAPAGHPAVRSPLAYATPREAHLVARAQANYYAAAGLLLIRTANDLARHCRGWRPGRLAAVLLLEGADPIEEPAQVDEWARLGVRVIGLAWSATRYAGGTGQPGGLTKLGRELLRRMEGMGLILDVSHLAGQAVAEAFEAWKGPLIASHSNARTLASGDRQLADETLAEIGRRGGVVGVSFYRKHLRGDDRPARLDDVVRHLRHLARATGGPEHVGLGTDADGGFSAKDSAVRAYSELGQLQGRLRRHFSSAATEGIMGGNWILFLRRHLPAG